MNTDKTGDSFSCREKLTVGAKTYQYFSLPKLAKSRPGIARYPYSVRILLEAVLRAENGKEVTRRDVETFLG